MEQKPLVSPEWWNDLKNTIEAEKCIEHISDEYKTNEMFNMRIEPNEYLFWVDEDRVCCGIFKQQLDKKYRQIMDILQSEGKL